MLGCTVASSKQNRIIKCETNFATSSIDRYFARNAAVRIYGEKEESIDTLQATFEK